MASLFRNGLLQKVVRSTSQIEIVHNNLPVQLNFLRCLSSSLTCLQSIKSINSDYVISPVYHNRNPRNLEKLALARKRLGWKFQAPRKDYYNKLVLQRSIRHTHAWVEHSSGKVVVSASTKENAIGSQLHSFIDVSACENIGRVLAQRCLECGITEVFFDEAAEPAMSDRVQSFLQAFKDLDIALTEPEMKVPEFRPGINYDGYNRYAEPKVWKEDFQDL